MDLGGWLRGLGLEQYEAAFRDNAIDETLLPNLTAEDLKDLGVVIVGHRRKLLDAIEILRATTKAKATPAESQSTIDSPSGDTAERRQVTVLFSDLVGSTALSAQMDPEDLREVISLYQKSVAETVRRFGGFVAKYLGADRSGWRTQNECSSANPCWHRDWAGRRRGPDWIRRRAGARHRRRDT